MKVLPGCIPGLFSRTLIRSLHIIKILEKRLENYPGKETGVVLAWWLQGAGISLLTCMCSTASLHVVHMAFRFAAGGEPDGRYQSFSKKVSLNKHIVVLGSLRAWRSISSCRATHQPGRPGPRALLLHRWPRTAAAGWLLAVQTSGLTLRRNSTGAPSMVAYSKRCVNALMWGVCVMCARACLCGCGGVLVVEPMGSRDERKGEVWKKGLVGSERCCLHCRACHKGFMCCLTGARDAAFTAGPVTRDSCVV